MSNILSHNNAVEMKSKTHKKLDQFTEPVRKLVKTTTPDFRNQKILNEDCCQKLKHQDKELDASTLL